MWQSRVKGMEGKEKGDTCVQIPCSQVGHATKYEPCRLEGSSYHNTSEICWWYELRECGENRNYVCEILGSTHYHSLR